MSWAQGLWKNEKENLAAARFSFLFFHNQIQGLLEFFFLLGKIQVWILKGPGDLVADDQAHGAVDAGADSGQLGDNVDTLLFVFNHFLDTAELAFGSFEAVEDVFFFCIHAWLTFLSILYRRGVYLSNWIVQGFMFDREGGIVLVFVYTQWGITKEEQSCLIF